MLVDFLVSEYKHYLEKANQELSPIFLNLSQMLIATNDKVLLNLLAIIGGLLFIVFVKYNYPPILKILKNLKKEIKDPNLYAYVDGALRYIDRWDLFIKNAYPVALSYVIFFSIYIVKS